MKKSLSDEERHRLDGLVADVEKRTDSQIVLAVIKRSDSYAELPWKAFALGGSLCGLLVFILDVISYNWSSGFMASLAAAGILAAGALFALIAVLWPGFARWFLTDSRADVEVRQYAESLFLSREVFATVNRTGILMLVSLFERKIVILPDKGLRDQLTDDALQYLIAAMTPLLKRRETGRAFEAGLQWLSRTLTTGKQGTAKNELSNEIIEEEGE